MDKTIPAKELWGDPSRATTWLAVAGDFLPWFKLSDLSANRWQEAGANLAPIFDSVQLAIANFEGCLPSEHDIPKRKSGTGSNLACKPESLEFLKNCGVSAISVANNHVFDFGKEGFGHTIEALQKANLTPFGFRYENQDQTILLAELQQIRVGIWAAVEPRMLTLQEKDFIPSATLKAANEALQKLKAVTVRIAYLHMGLEGSDFPEPDDVDFAHALITLGFDLVFFVHSHRISGYEQVQRADNSWGFIFYGLGSLTSGYIFDEPSKDSIIVAIGLTPKGVCAIKVIPLRLTDEGFGTIPSKQDANRIFAKFDLLSQAISNGSFKKEFYAALGTKALTRQWADFKAAVKNRGIAGLLEKLTRLRLRHIKRLVFALIETLKRKI